MPYKPIPLDFTHRSAGEMIERASAFHRLMTRRRSVREFSDRPVPRELIRHAVATACSAPSGANRQPWHFVAVSDQEVKRRIRKRAEEEEYESYHRRMPQEWLEALEHLGTTWRKPFLETVPWLVVCFAELYGEEEDGRSKNYYVQESCGIACGLFIAAVHNMGLATLTHTPSPMAFLSEVLDRPENEKAYMLFPVGYPHPEATVPEIRRKQLDQQLTWA